MNSVTFEFVLCFVFQFVMCYVLKSNRIQYTLQVFVCVLALAAYASAGFLGGGGGGYSGGGGGGWSSGGGGGYSGGGGGAQQIILLEEVKFCKQHFLENFGKVSRKFKILSIGET